MTTALVIALSLGAAVSAPQTGGRWTVPHLDAEARRLTVGTQADWYGVLRLVAGKPIVITERGRLPEPRRFLAADDAEIVVLNDRHPELSARTRRVLLDMAYERVDYARLFRGELFFVHENVRVAADGVFAGDRKIADTSEVIERIPRGDVLVVALPPKRHGSILGAVIGAGGGFLIGFPLAVGIAMEDQCGRSCNDEEAKMALVGIGLPIAGGVLGYHVVSRTTQTIIYESPRVIR